MKDATPATSGIYKITCTVTRKIYIGSAINLSARKSVHFCTLQRNKHVNPILQNAWNKYGEDAFVFEVLELVLPMSLTAREQYWLNKLSPFGRKGYNILPEAGSPLGKKFTPETREKIRQKALGRKMSPEAIEKMRQSALARKVSPEKIEKMRQANLGKKHTPERIEKVRQTNKGKKPAPQTIEAARQVNLGKKRSPEAIEKARQTNLAKRSRK